MSSLKTTLPKASMALDPASSAAIINAMEYLMVGRDGERPKTLLEILNWLAQQAVKPTHVIGKSFEKALRDDATSENNLLDMMANPQELRKELENLLSPGIFNYTSALEQVLLGNLTWNRLPGEFLFVWLLGRNRWSISNAFQVRIGELSRAGFITVSPRGKHILTIFATGTTDEEAENQGLQIFKELQGQGILGRHPEIKETFIITLSTENKGSFRKGKGHQPHILRLHGLSDYLIKHA